MSLIRLDKYLADMQIGTRSEVKKLIRAGKVRLDDMVCRTPEEKFDPDLKKVAVDGRAVDYVEYEYFMLNKPAGCISATEDSRYPTVLDYITDHKRKDLFPVGRLDLDTEGLLLITNDGALSHELLSPSRHIPKTYYADIDGIVTEEDITLFEDGVDIGEKELTRPAQLVIRKSNVISQVELTIYEGKFHQVKRMFEAIGKPVLYLKRISMGTLQLDPKLALGEYRPLTEEELHYLRQRGNTNA